MMIELWGLVHVVTSPAMKPLWEWLGSFSQDIAQDLLKDFVKDDLIISNWQRLPFTAQGRTVIRSLKSFVAAMEQEFDRLGCAPDAYVNPLKTFIRSREGSALLGTALNLRQETPDPIALAELWDELGVRSLPEGFDWSAVAAAYRSAVQAIVRESAELRAIAQFELTAQLLEGQQATADLLADRLGPAVGCDLAAYAERLRDRYSHLNLTSLDDRAYEDDRLRLWSVFVEPSARECRDYLPQQAELPKEWLAALGEEEPDRDLQRLERLRQSYLDQTPRPVLERIRSDRPDDRHLVILGDPGAGKSTLLRYLALDWAEEEVFEQGFTRSPAELDGAIVPLLVELQQYASDRQDGRCGTLLDFMETGSFCAHLSRSAIDQRLKTGRAWLFLDGLDEVFEPAERQAITVEIARLAEQYPQAKIVVTSRVIGYKPYDLSGAEFRHFLLQDLDETQINQFIGQWHQLVKRKDEQFLQLRRDRLTRAVQQSKQIRELAGNPLLLTMMAILNLHQELPRDRFLLYEQAARVLLHQWDVERALESDPELATAALDFRDKQAMLRRVARVMQDSPDGLRGNLIREEDLEREFRDYLKTNDRDNAGAIAKRLIRQLRERNFILCLVGPGLYAFVHRTFLEYFCAASFLWDFKETQTLTIEALIAETFGKHWAEESWHEVLRLIASELDQKFVEQIIEFLLSVKVDRQQCLKDERLTKEAIVNLLLAADCLIEIRKPNLNEPVFVNLLHCLQAETNERNDQRFQREAAEGLLSRIAEGWQHTDDLRPWFESLIELTNRSYFPIFAVVIVAQRWKDDPDTLPMLKDRARSDENWAVRVAAVAALAQGWKDDPDTLPMLKDRARSDENWAVRVAAVEALAQGWKDDPDTLPMLKDRARSDEDNDVRRAAVEALAQGWKDDPATLPLLKDRARSDEDGAVRRAVVWALAQGWKDDPDTLPWLKDRARSDENLFVRQAAVEALAQGWKDDPDTLPWLKDRARSDEDNDVRQAAVEALAQGWKDHPDTLPWLKDRARSDEDNDVRRAAAEALAQGWKDDPDTLPLLKDRARSDENWAVRQAAVEALAQGWKDDPDTLPLLKDRARSDEDNDVRQAAVEALAQGWKDDPDTLPLLKDRARSDESEYVRQAAVQALAQGWKDDPDTFNLLCEITTQDPFQRSDSEHRKYERNPRQTALEGLLEIAPKNPQVIDLLRDRAANDPDDLLREWATEQLAKIDSQSHET